MGALKIEQLLRLMAQKKASDLHIRVGVPPIYRINGELVKLVDTPIDAMTMDSFLMDMMNRDQMTRFENNKECDFAVGARDMGRFRVNVFRQRGTSEGRISGCCRSFDSRSRFSNQDGREPRNLSRKFVRYFVRQGFG